MRIATAQLPEPPRGADRVAVTGNAVVVLDGASAIEPVSVPPGVYADHLGKAVTAALSADPGAGLRDVLAEAIAATAGELGLAGDDCPSSTLAVIRVGGQVDLLVLGDSFIFYDTGSGTRVLTDDRLAQLHLPEGRRYRERLAAGTGYDAMSSSGSNLGPTNPALISATQSALTAYRAFNHLAPTTPVPSDAVTSSGSGLDPEISIANARLQAPRVAAARGVPLATVLHLVDQATVGRVLDVMGEPGVNVLDLNISLARLGSR